MASRLPAPELPEQKDLGRLLSEVAMAAIDAERAEEVLGLAIERVCAVTRWPVGHAYIHEPSTAQLLPSPQWHLSDPEAFEAFRRDSDGRRFEPGEGLPGRVLADGRPHWITDVRRDEHFPRNAAAADSGLRAAFAFPVRSRSGVVAVLEFFSDRIIAPDEELIRAVEVVGAQVGHVFERVRSAEEMREREGRFRAVAENAADAIITVDESDRVVYANPAVEQVFGYSREELGRIPFTQLMPERFRSRHREGLRRFVHTGERRIPWNGVELPGLHRDGYEIPLEITFGVFSRDGRHYFTGIMRDIRDRKRAEEERTALLEREREARGEAERRAGEEAALRAAAAAVSAAFTAEETVRRIAENAVAATRADASFVERICVGEGEVEVVAVAGDRAPELGTRSAYAGSFTQRVVETERPELIPRLGDAAYDLPPNAPDTCADCSAAIMPLLNGGEPVGALILLRAPEKLGFREDEIERAFTFAELAALAFRKIHLLEDSERRREELQRVMESRNRLMRGFTHDVKNPLGAADGLLALLEEGVVGELTDPQRDKLARARRSVRSALDLIEDLLDLARVEGEQIEVKAAPTDVREAAREIVEDFMSRAEERALRLELEVPSSFPVIVSDPSRIRQVVANLVSNAVKYTPSGGRVDVHVHLEEPEPGAAGAGRALIHVRDTGPGIPADKQPMLFQEFTRLDPDAAEGAGIGLAISRRVARALGGDVEVDSEPGRGSIFTLWVPLRRVEDEGAAA